MKTTLLATAAIALATPAFAQVYYDPSYEVPRSASGYTVMDPDVTGSIVPYGYASQFPTGRVETNSAAEGNAEQNNKPVPSYGQVSGGPAARFEE